MNMTSQLKHVLFSLLGLICLVLFLWIFQNTPAAELLSLQISKDAILEKADSIYNQYPFQDEDLTRRLKFKYNEDLFRFNQTYLPEENRFKVGRIEVTWKGKIFQNDQKKEVRLQLTFDFHGELQGFERELPELADSTNLTADQALSFGRQFLQTQNIDTTSIELANKSSTLENGLQEWDFTFTGPSALSDSLKNEYSLKLVGSTVTQFDRKLIFDEEQFTFPNATKTVEIVFAVIRGILWFVAVLLVIVVFFKRLRHDEVELKRSIWIGAASFLIMWMYIAIDAWPQWEGVLLGGGFGGLFTGIGVFIIFGVIDSLNREVWPQKLKTLDIVFRGHFRIRELGFTFLKAIAFGGIVMLILGLLTWVFSEFGIGYIKVRENSLNILENNWQASLILLENIIFVLFIGLLLLSFTPAYIRTKFHHPIWIIVILAIIYDLIGLHSFYLRPDYFSVFFIFPIALLWGYIACKFDLTTTLLAVFFSYTFLDFSIITLLPEGFFSLVGWISIVFLAIIFAIGLILSYSGQGVSDFSHYVPEYVSRIAERERMQRELEIARRMQYDFLPQKIPALPSLDIAAICEPAMEVGGDYYDIISKEDNMLSVIVGDVSGKGVSAAFYMTMVKGIIKTLAKWVKTPAKILTEVNDIFYANSPRHVFVSALYGIFDMNDRTLIFARAGHNPLFVRKQKTKEMELFCPTGIAIGMERGPLFAQKIKEQSVSLESGDIFIFYTDGISEAMNVQGEEFGEERLRELMTDCAHLSAQEILDKISNAVFNFAGDASQHDDFTMVVVKVI